MDEGRLPPNSVEAEEACLGSLLLDPGFIYEVASYLHAEDFYRSTNRDIYKGLLELSEDNEQIDIVSLGALLRRKEVIEEIGGEV